ncbi:hypothetical protein BOS5A_231090 [Bosea sp. EC-HK365B]|nr:hypothetical protein BOSE7B_50332 [Bosea sp. 7B]CAD5300000.1 hypothetical protein BOSE21B_91163 [Bosea sp. 21B]VVT61822.1 hypothetical protein BOS5A_231090 [Bosea sp. EC-HK365B]VXB42626.1 hypothetical protein BOSE125_130752 [Bosea sp. 125]VXC99646.1 hypothetical protein BOSE127_90334 [Bosea sp. 127]
MSTGGALSPSPRLRWGRVRDGGPESRNAILNRFAKRHCPPPHPSPPQAGGGRRQPC